MASHTLCKAVMAYVREHLGDPALRSSSVGAALGVSRRSVQSVFERMSTTATAFIQEQRLICAADWLHHTPGKLSITEIAFSCGFSDSAYFSRCFHKKFGMAPRDYHRRASRLSCSSAAYEYLPINPGPLPIRQRPLRTF